MLQARRLLPAWTRQVPAAQDNHRYIAERELGVGYAPAPLPLSGRSSNLRWKRFVGIDML